MFNVYDKENQPVKVYDVQRDKCGYPQSNKNSRLDDLTGLQFGKLTVKTIDWDRYEKDKAKRDSGEIKKFNYYWICECECGKKRSVVSSNLKNGHTTSCGKCYTFEQWCKDNSRQDYLDLWDYELNEHKPNEIGCLCDGKYWFRCSKGIHASELKTVYVPKTNGELYCKKCNSFGQYLIDTYGNIDVWVDNNVNPFEVPYKSNKKFNLRCLDCGNIKKIACCTFVDYGLACSCGDGQSYPNKFIYKLLSQLNIAHEKEKKFDWSFSKKYDIYIQEINCVIENHGEQHYNGGFTTLGGRSLEEEQENDKHKRELALSNGIKHYIELDCSKSGLEWIKQSVMSSELPELLNFKEDDINWIECEKFALKNLVKEVCDLWEVGNFNTTRQLATHLKIGRTTVARYLDAGNKLGWCTYNANDEMKKTLALGSKKSRKKVEIFRNGESLGVFKSISELVRTYETMFGIKLLTSNISNVCKGKRKTHCGFTFKYKE